MTNPTPSPARNYTDAEIADRIKRDFAHHPPQDEDTIARHQMVREACGHAADVVNSCVPPGREKAMAITALEHAMMNANAGIARIKPLVVVILALLVGFLANNSIAGPPDGFTVVGPDDDLQSACDAAPDGANLWVVGNHDGPIELHGRELVLVFDPDAPGHTVTGNGAGPAFEITDGSEVTIVGANMTLGRGAVRNGARIGGGVLIEDSAVHLIDVSIRGCNAALGGGVAVVGNSEARFTDVLIRDNEARIEQFGQPTTPGFGGGVFVNVAGPSAAVFFSGQAIACGNKPDAYSGNRPSDGLAESVDCGPAPIASPVDVIDVNDMVGLFRVWETNGGAFGDLNEDGRADTDDLLIINQAWTVAGDP